MKLLRCAWVLAVLSEIGFAAPAPAPTPAEPAPKKKESSSEWVFSLLPKSLQKNPRLELTVITEMTEAGRKRAPVSPQAPAYFEAFTTGPRHLGHAPANEKTLAPAQIEKLLTQSLATASAPPPPSAARWPNRKSSPSAPSARARSKSAPRPSSKLPPIRPGNSYRRFAPPDFRHGTTRHHRQTRR